MKCIYYVTMLIKRIERAWWWCRYLFDVFRELTCSCRVLYAMLLSDWVERRFLYIIRKKKKNEEKEKNYNYIYIYVVFFLLSHQVHRMVLDSYNLHHHHCCYYCYYCCHSLNHLYKYINKRRERKGKEGEKRIEAKEIKGKKKIIKYT